VSVLTQTAIAVILGGALAAGILLAAARMPRWSAPSLSRRIAPYVRDIADPRGITPLAAPSSGEGGRSLRDRIASAWAGSEGLSRRLRQADWSRDAVSFRATQLGWAVAGLGAGGLFAVALALAGAASPTAALLPPVFAVSAMILSEYRLTTAARRRLGRIQDELPTVLEFLALCLSAGEGLRDALRRVGEVGSGELTIELRRAVLASGTGSSLSDALLTTARHVDVPALSRALEHIVAAIERGAPLAHVLQDQAGDAREDAKQALIATAGRKEIHMLLPLVFLILPLSVLFAVFPGVVMLKLGIE